MSERDLTRSHDHDHATSITTHDGDVEPGRRTRAQALTAPTHPIASGLIQRKARDANGVADGAEHALASAANSSGSALPDMIQRKFEGSLGTDLSSVRVHTGNESAAAADAVGARAYAVGQDIHFGAGQYDPSSPAGEHLLAHEVAHTVQQRGGTPTRQNKLAVSSPHDAAEHEADRAADAMVSGAAFAVSGAPASTSSRAVHRALNKRVPAIGWGGSSDGSFTFNPNAEITAGPQKHGRWFVNSAMEEVEVAPDTRGTIVLRNPFYWVYHEINTTTGLLGSDTTHTRSFGGPIEATVTASYSVDKDGKVVISPPVKNGIVGFPAVLDGSVESVKQDGQDEGSINISTILKSTKAVTTGTATTQQVGTSGDFKPGGIGGGASSQNSATQQWGATTTGSGTWMGTYGIVIKVKRKPPTPVTQKIIFDMEGKFLSGDEGINGVNSWWGRIPEPVRREIKLGKKSVFIYGNASKTGTPTKNQEVVANRIADVRKKLRALTERIDIVPENTGSVNDERSVVIEVRYTPEEANAGTP